MSHPPVEKLLVNQHPAGKKLLGERGKSCLGDLFVFLGVAKLGPKADLE